MAGTLGDELRRKESELVRGNAARRIHETIKQVKGKASSARRWPWELIQNACDAGKTNQGLIDTKVRVSLGDDKVIFEHWGGPFLEDDLSLLILAGSVKELRPVGYAGRFGSGFLVTHVLCETVLIEGQAKREDGTVQYFEFDLDRTGAPEDILLGIERAYNQVSISKADKPMARYTYLLLCADVKEAAAQGLSSLCELIPYVLAFVPHLMSVEVSQDGSVFSWQKGKAEGDGVVTVVPIAFSELSEKELKESNLAIIKVSADSAGACCAVRAEPLTDRSFKLVLPSEKTPKLFYPFPLIGKTEKLGLPVVIASDFEPTEERDDILLFGSKPGVENNKQKVKGALKGISVLAEVAVERRWANAHLVARLGRAEAEFGIAGADWWNTELNSLVGHLLQSKIVLTEGQGTAPPVELSFPVPLLEYQLRDDSPSTADIPVDRIWNLVEQIRSVPALEIAQDWQVTIRHWNRLRGGNTVDELIDATSLADEVRNQKTVMNFSQQLFDGDGKRACQWLRDFFELLQEYQTHTKKSLPAGFLDDLIPNQKGVLKSPKDLARDVDIPAQLKDIAEGLGWRIRESLLDGYFLVDILSEEIQKTWDTFALVERLVTSWVNWKEGSPGEDYKGHFAMKLLVWMALNDKGDEWKDRAVQVPVFAEGGRLVRVVGSPALLTPVLQWEPDARIFADVFKFERSRLLWGTYLAGLESEDKKKLCRKLAAWHIIYPGPVIGVCQAELDAKELQALLKDLSSERAVRGRHTIRTLNADRRISTIPFLSPELIGALGQDPERARKFMQFVLKFVLAKDPHCLQFIKVACSCGKQHEVYPAEWLAHLKTKSWVPRKREQEDEYYPDVASPESVKELLGPTLNEVISCTVGVELLRHLGFSSLELQIARVTQDDETKEEQLAAFLSKVKGVTTLSQLTPLLERPEELAEVLNEAEKRADFRDVVHRNQQFGKSVEEIVKSIFEDSHFKVESAYRGYDFAAYYKGAVAQTDLGKIDLGVGGKRFLVEVKATEGDTVRMTEVQAQVAVASKEAYILCVVDLQGNDLRSFGNAEDFCAAVRDSITIVDDIGRRLASVANITLPSSDGISVEIRGQINYVIHQQLWQMEGLTLRDWICHKVFGG